MYMQLHHSCGYGLLHKKEGASFVDALYDGRSLIILLSCQTYLFSVSVAIPSASSAVTAKVSLRVGCG